MRLGSLTLMLSCLAACGSLPSVSAFAAGPTLSVGSIDALVAQIKHPADAPERMRAAEGLALYGEQVTPIVSELLSSPDHSIRYAACLTLTRLGPEGRAAVPELVRIAADSSDPLQETAVYALGSMGADAAPATPVLHKLALAKSRPLRDEAMAGLQSIGGAAVPALAELLHHDEVVIRRQAATALRSIGIAAAAAAPELTRAMSDPDNQVSDQASLAVAALGAKSAPALLSLLDHESPATRRRAVMTLACLQPTPLEAVVRLNEALKDADPVVRFWAAKSLGDIAEPLPAEGLIAALSDSDADVRWQAVASLARRGVEPEMVELLTPLLHDPNPAVRAQAQKALAQDREKP